MSLEGDFSFDIKVLDQKVICGNIPRLRRGFCNEKLGENEIRLTDNGKCCPNIDLFIGADYCGKILIGKMRQQMSNSFACGTYLGWKQMDELTSSNNNENLAMHVTSLLIQEASMSDLWNP